MSYDAVVEKVRTVPQNRLADVASFIDTISDMPSDVPSAKRPFFDLAGKIHLDKKEIQRYRELNMI